MNVGEAITAALQAQSATDAWRLLLEQRDRHGWHIPHPIVDY